MGFILKQPHAEGCEGLTLGVFCHLDKTKKSSGLLNLMKIL